MLNCIIKTRFSYNKNLSEYCSKIKNETMRKLTEKYNLDRKNLKNLKYKNLIDYDNGSKYPEFNFYTLLLFLSISSITFYFYRRIN